MNLVPQGHRSVAVATVELPLDAEHLRAHFAGRPAYRRTRYIIARAAGRAAVLEIAKRSEEPLFSEITAVEVLAGPAETAVVHAPQVDTGVPSQLARLAADRAPGARCVVVNGRYGHVGFILDPAPVRIHVVEVVPPTPPKLLDEASRLVDLAEDLPAVELVPELVDIAELARQHPAEHYLLPCRSGGVRITGAAVSYLDEIPERHAWTLIGCARSRAIHDWFYDRPAPAVDMCPRRLAAQLTTPAGEPVLTKCCLLEDRTETDGRTVVVGWGATLAEIASALHTAVRAAS
jgi:hypothetical protein